MFRDITFAVLLTVLILALVFGVVIGIAEIGTYFSCQQLMQINSQYNFQWGFWTGCLVQLPNGFYINTDRIQFVNGELTVYNK